MRLYSTHSLGLCAQMLGQQTGTLHRWPRWDGWGSFFGGGICHVWERDDLAGRVAGSQKGHSAKVLTPDKCHREL